MRVLPTILCCLVLVPTLRAEEALADRIRRDLDGIYADLDTLYRDLHRHPEVSLEEERTAGRLSEALASAGFELTGGVGGHGFVGLLENGSGPTVMLRTDLDALPILENTGLSYASENEGVMHACMHDVHMTSWLGAAKLLSGMTDLWSGTLMMVAQPAEEIGAGAQAMLDDGLFSRFPEPDAAFTLHSDPFRPAGTVGYTPGFAMASADAVDITVFGRGGHGASPHATIDPIVIAARIVVALQTIVAREIDPIAPAVVTVGSIHGGTKHNIIPDEVRLQLTVRAYEKDVRAHLLEAIERIARAEAAAAGATRAPRVETSQGTPVTRNDPEVYTVVAEALAGVLGEDNVVEVPPVMTAEDFSRYGEAGAPSSLFWLGVVDPEEWRRAREEGRALPPLHSPTIAPDRERTLKAGATAMTVAALALFRTAR